MVSFYKNKIVYTITNQLRDSIKECIINKPGVIDNPYLNYALKV